MSDSNINKRDKKLKIALIFSVSILLLTSLVAKSDYSDAYNSETLLVMGISAALALIISIFQVLLRPYKTRKIGLIKLGQFVFGLVVFYSTYLLMDDTIRSAENLSIGLVLTIGFSVIALAILFILGKITAASTQE